MTKLLAMPVNSTNEKVINDRSRELRGTIKDAAELQGKIRQGPTIQYQQYNVAFNEITSFMITDLCGDCRTKAINKMETLPTIEVVSEA